MSRMSNARAAFWPVILDKKSAHKAALLGVGAATFSAAATILLIVTGATDRNIDVMATVVVLCGIGFATFKHSRVGAVLGIILCTFFIFNKISQNHSASILQFLLLYYINGARGCFAYHIYEKAEIAKLKSVTIKPAED